MTTTRVLELTPVREDPSDYEELETRIRIAFRKKIFEPIVRIIQIPRSKLRNSSEKLLDAIQSGRIMFSRGSFSGRFNAGISKELKSIGARWDKKSASFKIPYGELPTEVKSVIAVSRARFEEKLDKADKALQKILPAEFAGSISMQDLFEKSLWKTEKKLYKTLKDITVIPELTPRQRETISTEWTRNMELWITDFTEKEIVKLRRSIQKNVYAGNRYEGVIKSIQDSYGVSERKAKFLAKQETSLMMAKYKETRYRDAGVEEYRWSCVIGSPLHPVRPSHKVLDGKIFRFDDPPVTTAPGEPQRRNNPGQDYNCRCSAIPIVRVK